MKPLGTIVLIIFLVALSATLGAGAYMMAKEPDVTVGGWIICGAVLAMIILTTVILVRNHLAAWKAKS